MSLTLKIRKAMKVDLINIVRLLAEDTFMGNREQFTNPLPVCYQDAFDAIDEDKNNLLVVAENELGIVGTLQITFIPNISAQGATRALIESIMVDVRCQNRGIGSQMMQFAITRARERNCRIVQLTSNKKRPDAHRFYDRLGFRATHEGLKLELA